MEKSLKIKRIINILLIAVVIPAVIIFGYILFSGKYYNIISMLAAFLACVPFFISFEKRKGERSRELVIIAVMSAISVLGRIIFAPFPGFKPVTAIVIIAASVMGAEAGFMTGALSAIVSNLFFGQGAWTPFQMFIWGFIGFITGLIAKTGLMKTKPMQIFIAILGGVAFSMMMDIWTTISIDGYFSFVRYFSLLIPSIPFMAIYAVSNVIFVLILYKPFTKKLDRLKIKYNLFSGSV